MSKSLVEIDTALRRIRGLPCRFCGSWDVLRSLRYVESVFLVSAKVLTSQWDFIPARLGETALRSFFEKKKPLLIDLIEREDPYETISGGGSLPSNWITLALITWGDLDGLPKDVVVALTRKEAQPVGVLQGNLEVPECAEEALSALVTLLNTLLWDRFAALPHELEK